MSNFDTPDRPMAPRRVRVIPTLLIDNDGRLVKTVGFGKRTYIGDPINAVKIFNEKEVDELILMDIDASRDGRAPNYHLISDIVSEAFMPIGYGGGITSEDQIAQLYKCGIEKVVLSSVLRQGTDLITSAARRFGAQAVTVCLPVKKLMLRGQRVQVMQGKTALPGTPEEIARRVTKAGAGEIILYSVDRDGTYQGYDLDLLARVASAVDVPVVACGGASGLPDFVRAVSDGQASAVAAGSLFVYQSGRRGVLINHPSAAQLDAELHALVTSETPR
jgi:cyclase